MKNILVVAYQLHYSSGSEYAVAMDYVTNMSKSNKLTVLYGTCNGFHKIGNTQEMEEWCVLHPIENVTFVPVKPSFECKNYDSSLKGNYLFYQEYRLWHYDVKKKAEELMKTTKFDLIHYLGPIGYREPGAVRELDLPYIWGPIGGFGRIPTKLFKATFSLSGGLAMVIKGLLNTIQERTNKRVQTAVKNADVVLCATSNWKKTVEKIGGKNRHSIIEYLPENCINKLYPLNESKFERKTINLIYVGWLDSRKALILVLDALRQMPQNSPIKLHIVGNGPLRAKYEQYAKNNGIQNLVEWHGRIPREEVFQLMNNSHMMVLPSLMDANTTVIWEAMAMVIPTLALDHFGFHDTIKNEKTGILIKPNSYKQVVNEIASNLQDLICNPTKLKDMANAVLQDREQYTWESRRVFFEKVYDIAIENHKKRK